MQRHSNTLGRYRFTRCSPDYVTLINLYHVSQQTLEWSWYVPRSTPPVLPLNTTVQLFAAMDSNIAVWSLSGTQRDTWRIHSSLKLRENSPVSALDSKSGASVQYLPIVPARSTLLVNYVCINRSPRCQLPAWTIRLYSISRGRLTYLDEQVVNCVRVCLCWILCFFNSCIAPAHVRKSSFVSHWHTWQLLRKRVVVRYSAINHLR